MNIQGRSLEINDKEVLEKNKEIEKQEKNKQELLNGISKLESAIASLTDKYIEDSTYIQDISSQLKRLIIKFNDSRKKKLFSVMITNNDTPIEVIDSIKIDNSNNINNIKEEIITVYANDSETQYNEELDNNTDSFYITNNEIKTFRNTILSFPYYNKLSIELLKDQEKSIKRSSYFIDLRKEIIEIIIEMMRNYYYKNIIMKSYNSKDTQINVFVPFSINIEALKYEINSFFYFSKVSIKEKDEVNLFYKHENNRKTFYDEFLFKHISEN